jgi:hypothetical protein
VPKVHQVSPVPSIETYSPGRNWYVDNVAVFKRERWELALEQAKIEAASRVQAAEIDRQFKSNLLQRLTKLQELQASYDTAAIASVDDANKQAFSAAKDEALERYKAQASAAEVNAVTGRTLAAATIEAQGTVDAAMAAARLEQERRDQAIQRQVSDVKDQFLKDSPRSATDTERLDAVRKEVIVRPGPLTPEDLNEVRQQFDNTWTQATLPDGEAYGKKPPHGPISSIAKTVGNQTDPVKREQLRQLALEVAAKRGTPADVDQQDTEINAYAGVPDPSLADPQAAAAAAKLEALRAASGGRIDEVRLANAALPAAQGGWETKANVRATQAVKMNAASAGGLQTEIDQVKAQLALLEARSAAPNATEKDLIDRAREIYWDKFGGRPRSSVPREPRVPGTRSATQTEDVPSPKSMVNQVLQPPASPGLSGTTRSTAPVGATDPWAEVPVELDALRREMQSDDERMQGELIKLRQEMGADTQNAMLQREAFLRTLGVPDSSIVDPVSGQARQPLYPSDVLFRPDGSEIWPAAQRRIDAARAARARDYVVPSSIELLGSPTGELGSDVILDPAALPIIPNPAVPPGPDVPPAGEIDIIPKRKGSVLPAFQGPPAQTGQVENPNSEAIGRLAAALAKGRQVAKSEASVPKTETSNPQGIDILNDVDDLLKTPAKAERLLNSRDGTVKAAAGMYAQDKRAGVPITRTVEKLKAAFANDPEKQRRALSIAIYLHRRSQEQGKIETVKETA